MEEKKDIEKTEIYSQRVRAGKRTYFFDVKSTRSNDYYLTITESKRRYKEDGYFYEKHKIFLYKEDFDKFIGALKGTIDHVKTELMPEIDFSQFESTNEEQTITHSEQTISSEEQTIPGDDSATEKDTELKWE